jgi:threonine/homoserine/homoserine lactone efflux protein
MSSHGLALFCLAYLLAAASPGPGIAAIVARVLGRGVEGIIAFIAGYVVGDLVWFTFAATGMAMLAQTAHTAFLILKYAGAAYLFYLAWRLWTAPVQAVNEEPPPGRQGSTRLFLGSLALTLGNPKVMVFFLALLPTVLELEQLTLPDFLKVAAAICIILTVVLSFYTLTAMRARRLFRSSRAIRWLNRGTGTVMAGAAVVVATR